jgi:hypothetical protein
MAKILASTFNAVRNKVAYVIGTPSNITYDLGYNLTPASYIVGQDAKVYGQDFNQVLADVNTCLDHQSATTSPLSLLEGGKLISAIDLSNLSTAVDAVYSARNNVGPNKLSVTTSHSVSIAAPGPDYWGSYLTHRVRFDWGSQGDFRGWLNLGGFISIGQSLGGGSGTPQDISWTNHLAGGGNIVLAAVGAFQNNNSRSGTFPNGGIYNLIANGQLGANAGVAFRMSNSQDLTYSSNYYRIMLNPFPNGASVFDATGFELEFQLRDDYVPGGTTNRPDKVTGAVNISVATYYSLGKTPSSVVATSTVYG